MSSLGTKEKNKEKRTKAVEYLNELEDMLIRIECSKEYSYSDVVASIRACYWLFNEYLRLEERYDIALTKLEKNDD